MEFLKVPELREKLKNFKKEGKFKGNIYTLRKAELISVIKIIEEIDLINLTKVKLIEILKDYKKEQKFKGCITTLRKAEMIDIILAIRDGRNIIKPKMNMFNTN